MNDSSNKHGYRSSQGIVVGLVVIAVGLFFLLRNFGVELPFLYIYNWWALFILIAAVAPLTQAIAAYRGNRRLDAVVARHLLTAVVIVTVAVILLADMRWNRWWPLFLIYGGCWMLLRERSAAD